MRRSYSRPSDSRPSDRGIDLTPMLDVVFILLIFFVVSATFIKETGLDLSPPEPETQPPIPPTNAPIVVAIDGRDGFRIDGRMADVRALGNHLARITAQRPESDVVVLPDPNTSTQAVIAAFDAARAIGVRNIKLGERAGRAR